MKITQQHTDAAYNWYNNPARSKQDFEAYAAGRGVVLFGDARTHPDIDWADVVMSLYDTDVAQTEK